MQYINYNLIYPLFAPSGSPLLMHYYRGVLLFITYSAFILFRYNYLREERLS